jgi:hypothetical protein
MQALFLADRSALSMTGIKITEAIDALIVANSDLLVANCK